MSGRMTPAAGPATSPFQKLVTLANRVATKFNGSLTDLSPGVPHGHQYCLSLRADYILPPQGLRDFDKPPFDREFHFCSVRGIDQWCTKGSAGSA